MKDLFLALCFALVGSSILISQHQDCYNPLVICDMGSYRIPSIEGNGNSIDQITDLSCSSSQMRETNSYWFSWTVKSQGTMTFVIDPENLEDDFDFILFEKNGNCNALKEIRCMASGEEIGAELNNIPCKGSTGLSIASIDEFEKSGCKYEDDNYLKMLSADSGQEYILFVNNYDSAQGFTISFEGTPSLKATDECKHEKYATNLNVLNIYPNPAKNRINIDFEVPSDDKVEFELLDLSGKLIYKTSTVPSEGLNKHGIDITQFPSASYLLKIVQGENSTIKQFIKA